MAIDKYTYFIENVKFYMNNLIEMYEMEVYLDLETDINQAVFLENKICKIWLCTLVTFPYQSVSFKVYKKEKDNLVEIETSEILKKFNFQLKEFDKLWLDLNRSIDFPTDSEFAGYQSSLISNEKIIMKYYMPLVINKNNSES